MVTVLVAVVPHSGCRTCWVVGPALNRASWIGSKRYMQSYAIICTVLQNMHKNLPCHRLQDDKICSYMLSICINMHKI